MAVRAFFSFILTFVFVSIQSQTYLIKGKVTDAHTGEGVSHVQISEASNSQIFYTDYKGYFQLNLSSESGTLYLSKEGYISKIVPFSKGQNPDTIILTPESILLSEVNLDIKKNTVTEIPILKQPIVTETFQKQVAHGELIDGLKFLPSVYVTSQGGGMGDGKISLRGFDPAQTAVLLNNIPVNDMETGWVYWSNWSDLSDITHTLNIQSGMQNQNIPLSTFGGTISVQTFQDNPRNFSKVKMLIGNNMLLKASVLHHIYNQDTRSSFTAYIGRNSGDGEVQGTAFKTNTYYFDFSKKTGKHLLQASIYGAPQWHGQRSSYYNHHMATLGQYLEYGRDYNYNFGYYNSQPFNLTENYFHKNLINLKWLWNFDNSQKIETTLYGSFSVGGSSYEAGFTPEFIKPESFLWRNTSDGLVNWDKLAQYNSGERVQLSDGNFYQRTDETPLFTYINTPFGAGITKIAFTNKHHWVGGILDYKKQFENRLNLNLNYHYRYSFANNFDRLANLLGADGYMIFYDQNNFGNVYTTPQPLNLSTAWNLLKDNDTYDKLHFHYQAKILLHALSAGLNYQQDHWNWYAQTNVSLQQNQRTDFFNYLYTDENRTSKWVNQYGFTLLTGGSYHVQNNTWNFSAGYLQKPNRFENIFLNYKNDVNPALQPESAFSTELGYGFKGNKTLFKTNLYYTKWADKFISVAYTNAENQSGTAFLNGAGQRHFGIEALLNMMVHPKLKTNATFAWGNWKYQGTASGTAYDGTKQKIGDVNLNLDDIKVGDAPQMNASLQLDYQINENIQLSVQQYWFGKLYSQLNFTDAFTDQDTTINSRKAIELPDYFLTDLGLYAKLYQTNKVKISLDATVKNLFDTLYIAESHTNIRKTEGLPNWHGIDYQNKVFFGPERTWSLGFTFTF